MSSVISKIGWIKEKIVELKVRNEKLIAENEALKMKIDKVIESSLLVQSENSELLDKMTKLQKTFDEKQKASGSLISDAMEQHIRQLDF